MKVQLPKGAGLAILILLLGTSPSWQKTSRSSPASSDGSLPPQEYPAQKPKSDYMSQILGRNTKPLGLKEDLAVRRLLRQPAIRWAIRAGHKHILN